MSAAFDEVEAATKLGFPGEQFESITPGKLDGLFWVRIGTGDKKILRPVIVLDGRVVSQTGYEVGSAWLRRVAAAHQNPDHDLWYVPQVLRWYEALPIGWSENADFDPKTGERAHVTFQPIEVKLVSGADIPRRRRIPDPSGAPSGVGDGPSGGPSGGYAPPNPCRAILREIAGKLTWVVEIYDASTTTWLEELREPAE